MSGSGSAATYTYQTTLAAGSHNYYFEFSDGMNTVKLPTSGTYSGPTVETAPDLELIGGISGTHDEIINGLHYIIGSIKNNTYNTYSYVQITFIILDKDKNQIETALDNINDLQPFTTWKFKALVYDDEDFAYYRLGDISGW